MSYFQSEIMHRSHQDYLLETLNRDKQLTTQKGFINERQYLKFFEILKEVHAESSLKLKKEFLEFSVSRILPQDLPANFDEFIKKINIYSVNLLFAAEAANRLDELNDVPEKIISLWVSQLQISEPKHERPMENFLEICQKIKVYSLEIMAKNEKIDSSIWLPKLSDSTFNTLILKLNCFQKTIFALVAERKVSEELINNELKKSLSFSFRSSEGSALSYYIMLYFYGQEMTKLNLNRVSNGYSKHFPDAHVVNLLQLLPKLQELDVSGNPFLTNACLEKHKKLKILTLNDTNIEPNSINRSLFPALETIYKENINGCSPFSFL